MFRKMIAGAGLALALAVGGGGAAMADVYNLTLDGCTTTCGTGPFGTVTVTPDATDVGSLDIVVQLAQGVFFNGAGNSPTHHSFVFDLVGSPAISIKNLTPGFTATPGPVSDAPFGNFGYAIDWVGPPNNNPTNVGLLSFEAFTGGAPLSLGFTNYNGQRLIFAADVYGTNGMTGNVGAVGAVPEPATWAMLIMGFGAIGATIRRRSRQAAAFA